VRDLPKFEHPDLIVGVDHFSDAGVYRLGERLAIVQTLDFFPPLVDDPYLFGQIAAANSLSDLYALGAEPRTAMNIVCFPDNELELSVLERILAGGAERVQAAGAVVLGGHSIRDAEIKYGLAVTGVVDPQRLITSQGARPGDAVLLTKPLGTGFVTTANKAGRCPPEVYQAACRSMAALNAAASRAAVAAGASAMTDITGFGLLGHAIELAAASGVTIELELARLPILPGAVELADRKNWTRAMGTNRQYAEGRVELAGGLDEQLLPFLYDPQTSGGLLVCIDPGRADEFCRQVQAAGEAQPALIGQVLEQQPAAAVVVR